MIPLTKLVEDRQNPREDYSNVPDLAVSMFGMGQLTPLEVRIEGEVAVITAGHRRFRAAKYVNEHYDEWMKDNPEFHNRFEGLMCRAEPLGLDDTARIFRQLNQGDHDVSVPLTPIERAKAYKKLTQKGVTLLEIGRRVGKTAQQIANTLSLIDAPKELQEAVEQGKMSPTAASKAAKATPEKRQKAVEKVKAGERVSVADVSEYVPLGLEKARKVIKKAQGYRDVSQNKAERARWEGVIQGLEIGVGLRPAEGLSRTDTEKAPGDR